MRWRTAVIVCAAAGVAMLGGCSGGPDKDGGAPRAETHETAGMTEAESDSKDGTGDGFRSSETKNYSRDKNGNYVDKEGNTYERDGSWTVPEGGRVDSQGRIIDKNGNVMGGGAKVGSKG